MSQTIDEVTEKLSDDLYEKTHAQLKAFLDETNALLALGDAMYEDRSAMARERLTAFLKGAEVSGAMRTETQPPVTRALNTAKDYVKAHPWAAVGAAVGAGVLVSLLFRHSRH